MATYAVGDIQGCYDQLMRLLDKINFDPTEDRLLSVGDLINRGPQSLETLRFAKSLGKAFTMVLGNHDLHFVALATEARKMARKIHCRPSLMTLTARHSVTGFGNSLLCTVKSLILNQARNLF